MKNKIIQNISQYIQSEFAQETSGHDWWHIYRVWKMSQKLARGEKTDKLVLEVSALLHDIADWKFNDGDEKAGSKKARKLLDNYNISKDKIDQICHIIDNISYKGAKVKNKIESLEGKIVQDADRLDAMGAIGIARAFHYGGYKGRSIYDPEVRPVLHENKKAYLDSTAPTLNHFYEKLFLLKDMMNTEKAKLIAQKRHKYMVKFVIELKKECNI